MRTVDWVTWIAAGLAIIAVAVAAWQLWRARQRAAEAARFEQRIRELGAAVQGQADRAEREAAEASSQARWAWEQVKLATSQVEQAKQEHRASDQAEQWEWAYALTNTARDLVDSSQELVRIALDTQVAPQYRLAANRHYSHATQRWQETMTKALARTTPTLQVQDQVATFAQVQNRLHGQLGVLLRAAETGNLSHGSPLSNHVVGMGKELETVRRHLQRTISAELSIPNEPPHDGQATQQIAPPSTAGVRTEQAALGAAPPATAARNGSGEAFPDLNGANGATPTGNAPPPNGAHATSASTPGSTNGTMTGPFYGKLRESEQVNDPRPNPIASGTGRPGIRNGGPEK